MAAWNTQEWRRIETALHQDPSKYRPGFQDWLVARWDKLEEDYHDYTQIG